jgi:hypothetical protein
LFGCTSFSRRPWSRSSSWFAASAIASPTASGAVPAASASAAMPAASAAEPPKIERLVR